MYADEAFMKGLMAAPKTKHLFSFQLLPWSWGTLYPPFKTPASSAGSTGDTDEADGCAVFHNQIMFTHI